MRSTSRSAGKSLTNCDQIAFLLCLFFLCACVNNEIALDVNGEAGPQAVIENPAADAVLLPGLPHDIAYYASHPSGVQEIEFSVNGEVIASDENPDPGSRLFAMRRTWTPETTGTYLLWVRARNTAGVWGDYSETVVFVSEPTATHLPDTQTATPSTTFTITVMPTPTFTPTMPCTPTMTLTPSITPTLTYTLTPVTEQPLIGKEGSMTEPLYSVNHVYYNGPACGPRLTEIVVQAYHPGGIAYAMLVYRQIDQLRGFTSEWEVDTMDMEADGSTVKAVLNGEDLTDFHDSWIEYQVVVVHNDGGQTRSKRYQNIEVSKCEQ